MKEDVAQERRVTRERCWQGGRCLGRRVGRMGMETGIGERGGGGGIGAKI